MQAQVGLVEEHYEDNPNVIVITALSDIGQPYSCNQWNNFSPNVTSLIIEDNSSIFNWFNTQNGVPSTVFIDENMTVQYKANYLNSYYMKAYIDELLGDCGDDCISQPPLALFEYAIDGLSVSFIDLSQEINFSVITDWNWNFGDGSISDEQYPEYTYNNPGTYYVVLNIVDQYGANGLEYWEYITIEDGDTCLSDPGDVTGDGSLNILDIVQVANYILGVSTPEFACAADLNSDENVNILDIVQIANAILDR